MQLADFYLLQCFCCNWYSELWLFSNYVKLINLNIFNPGLGSSTVDQVLKYPKHLPSTSTDQVLIFFKKYLSTSSTFKSSTSTHIKIGSKVGMDIQSRVNFGWTKQKGLKSPNHVLAQKSI